jgi:hypothetical protein
MSSAFSGICYGMPFPEGYKFPWMSKNFDYSDWSNEDFKDWQETLKGNDYKLAQSIEPILFGSYDSPKYIISTKNLGFPYCENYKKLDEEKLHNFLGPREVLYSDKDQEILMNFRARFCQSISKKSDLEEMKPGIYLISFLDD